MRLLAIGSSGRGKTTVIKQMMRDIQKTHKRDVQMIFCDYPDEFAELQHKNHPVMTFKKEQLNDVIDAMNEEQDEDLIKIPKTIFVDDSTSMTDMKKSQQLFKMLTQLRHINANVIIASHYLNALPIQVKQHFTDFILFAGISPEKLEMLWKQVLGNTLNCTNKDNLFNYDTFKEIYETHCQGSNLKFDDKRKLEDMFHNYLQVSLPSLEDPTKEVIKGNSQNKNGKQYTIKNAI